MRKSTWPSPHVQIRGSLTQLIVQITMPTDSSNLPKAEWNIPDSNMLIIYMGFLTKTGMNCFFGTKTTVGTQTMAPTTVKT